MDGIARWINRQRGAREARSGERPRRTREPVRKSREAGASIVEPAKAIGVLDSCEVLVVGGGPAGLACALTAARAGADVIIMERFNCFGGVITTVGMETLGWYRYEGTKDCEGSIGKELERVARGLGASRKFYYNDSECLDAEAFKSIADALLVEAGVRPYLHIMAVDVIKDGPHVEAVVTESKSGRKAIRCGYVVDCTGDADVAFLSGCECTRIARHESLGLTAVFNCAGVDSAAFLEHVRRDPKQYRDWGDDWCAATDKESELPSPYLETGGFHGSWSSLDAATGAATNLNLVHLKGFDACDVRDLTAAEMEGRRRVGECIRALNARLPGFEAAKLRNHAMTIGVRDSRKVVGRYNMTREDVCGQGRHDDCVGIFPEFVDGYSVLLLPTTGRFFHVPLGALVPRDPRVTENVLVAGRCVAGDNISHASMRNMMACTVSGGGAGAAAAVAIRSGRRSIHEVDVRSVQAELRRQGADLAGLEGGAAD